MQRLPFYPILLLLSLLTACGDTTYHSQLELLYDHSVPVISADSLARLMEAPGSVEPDSQAPESGSLKPRFTKSSSFILLDTRELHEWQLSHILEAQYAGFDNFRLNLPVLPGPETPVVLYCTIGYRSEQIGKQLIEAGYTNVSHVYGGIIGWKNQGHLLFNRKGEPTDSLHSYDRYWGVFLKNGIPIYE